MCNAKREPSARALLFTDLYAKMPLAREIFLLLRNNLLKLKRRELHLSHPGESGLLIKLS